MPPVGFEPTISAGERSQTYALDRATIATGKHLCYILLIKKLATIFGLGRPSSGQNIYKNFNAAVYNVLFVKAMGSHLQSCSIHKELYGTL